MPALTPSNPMTALVNLSLDAVALCNEGANSRAHILLTKRKENTNMTFDELMKALNPEQAAIVTKHISDIEVAKDKTIGDLNGQLTSLNSEVDTLKKVKPTTEPEDVLKTASPEIKALVEKLQGTVSGLVASQEAALAKERFAKVKAIPADETELMGVLKSASPATIAVLEKAAAAIEAGLVGKGAAGQGEFAGETADECYAKLEKSARALMVETPTLSFEKAFTVACASDSVTYAKYVKGVK